MIKKIIRLEYDFSSGKKTISFETTACTNDEYNAHIGKMLSQLELTRNKISKIEMLELFE